MQSLSIFFIVVLAFLIIGTIGIRKNRVNALFAIILVAALSVCEILFIILM